MGCNKTIYILRHGETEYNKQGIVQGRGTNGSLNQTGRDQAMAFHSFYGNFPFDMVVTSSLKRSFQTVRPFIDKGIKWHVLPEIDEISWGIYEGQAPFSWLLKKYRQLTMEWGSGQYEAKVEGGESASELASRVDKFIEFVKEVDVKNLLVCSHGRTIRCIMSRLMDDSLSSMENYPHSNTGLYTVKWTDPHFAVTQRNDTRHLISEKKEQ